MVKFQIDLYALTINDNKTAINFYSVNHFCNQYLKRLGPGHDEVPESSFSLKLQPGSCYK